MQMSTKAELDEANLFKRAVIALVWRVHEGARGRLVCRQLREPLVGSEKPAFTFKSNLAAFKDTPTPCGDSCSKHL